MDRQFELCVNMTCHKVRKPGEFYNLKREIRQHQRDRLSKFMIDREKQKWPADKMKQLNRLIIHVWAYDFADAKRKGIK